MSLTSLPLTSSLLLRSLLRILMFDTLRQKLRLETEDVEMRKPYNGCVVVTH